MMMFWGYQASNKVEVLINFNGTISTIAFDLTKSIDKNRIFSNILRYFASLYVLQYCKQKPYITAIPRIMIAYNRK